MHIVLLCGYYYPDKKGGTEAYVHMLATDLQEMGHEVTVTAPLPEDRSREYVHEGINVLRYPVQQNPSRAEVQGRKEPENLDAWSRAVERLQPDLVHMHSLTRGCGIAHARVVEGLGVPLFVTIHVPGVTCPRGTMMRWGTTPCDGEVRPVRCAACVLQSQGLPLPVAWGVGLLSSVVDGTSIPGRLGTVLGRGTQIQRQKTRLQNWLRGASHVFVVARWLKDVLTRNGIAGEHVTVSRHGLSDDMKSIHRAAAQRRSSRDPSAPLTVGFVGRFTKVKGCHVLVKAVRALPEEVRVETQLYGMAQNDKDEAYLQRLKRQAAGEPRIQFCGPMTGENRIEAFASFDVLAVPSLWFETGPYTVLEAFAANLPVLGSNHGGIEERMEDGRSGVLVPPGDVEEWTNALSRLYHRHTTGRWEWNLPVLRSSRDVAREIEDIYKKQK